MYINYLYFQAAVKVAPIRYKKHELSVIPDVSGLSREDLKAAMELEANMALEDRLLLETADKRNELEGYLYSMRDKLDGNLKSFIAEGDKDTLKNMMNDAEEWLYGDGFDSTKKQYSQRIDDLRLLSDPVESRFLEFQQRGPKLDSLKEQMNSCKEFANNKDEQWSHITDEDRYIYIYIYVCFHIYTHT
jgi:heat shock protein 4